MALVGNRSVLHKSPGRFLSGTVASTDRSNFSKPGMLAGRFESMSPIFAGIPSGHLAPSSWALPRIAGGGSGLAQSASDAVGALAAGRNIEGIAVSTSDATGTGQTVASISATAASASTASGTVFASLLAAGTAASASTAAGAVTAVGWATGSAASTSGASLVSYATGSLSGSTQDSGALTPASVAAAVWQAVAAEQNAAGTMGNKLNTASSGGVDIDALVEATLAAMNLTPPRVNVQQVNGATITGAGVPGSDPWRPA